ncbi:putative pentatricopeptide repeat protein [Diaporthe ampelina]|uniref:Putative pentatricopeptide repeat protein n=1 Tax=Diaporthe ampelina TaxID=1214573 RepID=A0A0G2FXI1_9PEZI|nr:putative pentatricopeptide repeat protein [Diaporthe ampelina]
MRLALQFVTSLFLRQGQDQEDGFAHFEAAVERQKTPEERQADKKKSLDKAKRAIKKELQYTTDPYHIADNVVKKLKENDFDKALLLTREASKNKQCVMKKRAQLPNAQTYTIIFKGCAESQHPKLAVGEALKIYNTMLSSSRLKPNITHLNAVLDVCSRAQDLESMFVTLRSADKARTPNNWTYTIILNALRHQPSNYEDLPGEAGTDGDAAKKSIETTVQRGKLVWDEVMSRWKKNEIIMDEELIWNYKHYLDSLSTGAASGKAARIIEGMPAEMVDGLVVRRGLLMCHFDGYNENAFENATVIFDAMMQKMRTPDAECMKLYLQVATSNYRKFDDRSKYPIESRAKLAYGRQIFNAVDRVWEPLRLATNALGFSDTAMNSKSPEETWKRDHAGRKSILDVAKRVVAVCDKMISRSLVQRGSNDARVILIRRKVMNEYVHRTLEQNTELGLGFKESRANEDDGELVSAF